MLVNEINFIFYIPLIKINLYLWSNWMQNTFATTLFIELLIIN